MPKNVVFLSGCHGTGKSTLKEKLLEQIPYLIRYDKCEMTSFEDIFERQIRRIAKYRKWRKAIVIFKIRRNGENV